MKLLALLPLGLLVALSVVDVPPSFEPWSASTSRALLGADEFGRDQLLVLLVAAGRSTMFGLALAAATIFTAVVFGYAMVFHPVRAVARTHVIVAQIVESVPVLIWVLVVVMAFGGTSAWATAIAFLLALLPFATTIVSGEFLRMKQAPFLEAARLLRIPSSRLLTHYLLPNSSATLAPLFIQITGLAVAIRGAIGLLGFTNRTDLDLGILLLRGKENMVPHPGLFVSTLVTFGLLYLYLNWLRRAFRGPLETSAGFA